MRARRRYEDLSQAKRRGLRAAASAAVMVAVYYQAPLDRPLGAGIASRFVLAMLALVGVVAWQVRAIVDSDLPRLRAIEAVAFGLPALLLLYASTYVLIAGSQAGSFTENLSRTDALYFTVTVFSTVGFGDIAPKSEVARVVTMSQMLMGLVAVGIVAKIVLGAVQVAVRHRADVAPADPPAASASAPAPGPSDG